MDKRSRKILLGGLMLSLLSVTPILAQSVNPEQNDRLIVGAVSVDQLSGDTSYDLPILAYDDDRETIPYQLNQYANGCGELLGTISGGSLDAKQSFQKLRWSSSDIEGTSEQYCVELCVHLLDDAGGASHCRLQQVSTVGTNQTPQITSVPAGEVEVEPGWFFDVQAQDADGDDLAFSLVAAPDFLSINPETGLLKIVSAPTPPGRYPVVLQVSDGSSSVQQNFDVVVTSHVLGANSGEFVADEIQTVPGVEIILLEPSSDTVYGGDSGNNVKWVVSSNVGVDEIRAEYSSGDGIWLPIYTYQGELGRTIEDRYEWDVSGIANGDFYLKLTVVTSEGTIAADVSDQFQIANTSTGTEDSKPLIININPADGTSTTDVRQEITGELIPSIYGDIVEDSFVLEYDGRAITSYCSFRDLGTVRGVAFSCSLPGELVLGSHQLVAQVSDSSGKFVQRDWIFEVAEADGSDDPIVDNDPSMINVLGLSVARGTFFLIVIICLLSLIFLLIPWLLYLLWRRGGDQGNDPVGNVEYNQYTYPATPEPVYTYPQPQQQYPQPVGVTPVPPPDQPQQYVPPQPQPMPQPAASVPLPAAQPVEPVASVPPATPSASPNASQTPDWLKPKDGGVTPPPYQRVGYGQELDDGR